MRLYERFGDSDFHSCLTTSFGIDFDAYEQIALPRLRGAGCSNNILLVDARMLTYALDGASSLPRYAGRHYTVKGVQAHAVFHPKIILQLGRRHGRAIISSANMTASGIAGNLEMAGLVTNTEGTGAEARLLAAAWQYMKGLVGEDERTLGHQLEWLEARTPWLFDTEPATDVETLADGSAAALLTARGDHSAAGIGTRFSNLVDVDRVERLVVLSPYWDDDLASVASLANRFRPTRLAVLIDCKAGLFPSDAASAIPGLEVFDLSDFGKGRFLHAKAIIAETKSADHILYGSANCTAAALGTSNYAGANHEACLYRRLPPGSALETLRLSGVLDGNPIPLYKLPAYQKGEELPLLDAAQRSPGRFEASFDTLFWRPPGYAHDHARIELLDSAGELLSTSLTSLPPGKTCQQFRMSGVRSQPAFARIRLPDGQSSAPAVVNVLDALREVVRDARGKKTEAAALALSEETEEGLWMWEVLNELERAETEREEPGSKRPEKSRDDDKGGEAYRTLSYDAFIAGRRLRSDEGGVEQNSLAGSDLSLVRNFLNRILTIGNDELQASLSDADDIAQGLDLGDETGDGAAALEEGGTFAPVLQDEAPSTPEKRQKAARAKASAEQIIRAVAAMNGGIKAKSDARELGPVDALRLRAMLMIIAAAGRPLKASKLPSILQVLPLSSRADGWPKLIGQVLFAFFGGRQPAIRHLQIDGLHDKVPDDIRESWATAFWSVQACLCAMRTEKSMHRTLSAVASEIYARTGLNSQELLCEGITSVFVKLNERFCQRLGLSEAEIEHGHARSVRTLQLMHAAAE